MKLHEVPDRQLHRALLTTRRRKKKGGPRFIDLSIIDLSIYRFIDLSARPIGPHFPSSKVVFDRAPIFVSARPYFHSAWPINWQCTLAAVIFFLVLAFGRNLPSIWVTCTRLFMQENRGLAVAKAERRRAESPRFCAAICGSATFGRVPKETEKRAWMK